MPRFLRIDPSNVRSCDFKALRGAEQEESGEAGELLLHSGRGYANRHLLLAAGSPAPAIFRFQAKLLFFRKANSAESEKNLASAA
jgi:hypothetical protein